MLWKVLPILKNEIGCLNWGNYLVNEVLVLYLLDDRNNKGKQGWYTTLVDLSELTANRERGCRQINFTMWSDMLGQV